MLIDGGVDLVHSSNIWIASASFGTIHVRDFNSRVSGSCSWQLSLKRFCRQHFLQCWFSCYGINDSNDIHVLLLSRINVTDGVTLAIWNGSSLWLLGERSGIELEQMQFTMISHILTPSALSALMLHERRLRENS